MRTKKFEVSTGVFEQYVSQDGIRYYPKYMIEDFADSHDMTLEQVCIFLQTRSEATDAKRRDL